MPTSSMPRTGAWIASSLTPTVHCAAPPAASGPGGGTGMAGLTRTWTPHTSCDWPDDSAGASTHTRGRTTLPCATAGPMNANTSSRPTTSRRIPQSRVFPHPGQSRVCPSLESDPVPPRRHPRPHGEAIIRAPLFLPHHGPRVGASHNQNGQPSAVRRSSHAQWPRVRRLARLSPRDRVHQGGQLFHHHRHARRLGHGRRDLVSARDDRAPAPGL